MSLDDNQLEPWVDLKGSIVMVTGASSGIGWEFCIDLANSGCKIIAAARRTDRLKSLCDQINQNGDVLAVAVELDVSADGPVIEGSVKKAWDAFGRIDALINNAGIRGPVRNPLNLSEEDWDRTFRTNVTGSWLVSKYVGQKMVASNQGGSIINISSTAGLNRGHLPGALAYATSKSALNTITKVISSQSDELILEAFKKMKHNQIGGLPVVEGPTKKIVGSVSIKDINFFITQAEAFHQLQEADSKDFTNTIATTSEENLKII